MASRVTPSTGMLADGIVRCLGGGRLLHVGAGDGTLVQALIERGVDAYGLDDEAAASQAGNDRFFGRFVDASPLSFSVEPGAFETVVASCAPLGLQPGDEPRLLEQLVHASARTVLLVVARTPDDDGTEALRARWESVAYAAGLRRHARMLSLTPFDALAIDGVELLLPFDVLDEPARRLAPWSSAPIDALRASGPDADARLALYSMAATTLKPGDRVLDLGCGPGDGSWILARNSRAAHVSGVSGDAAAIDYAGSVHVDAGHRVSYAVADIDADLAAREPASMETVMAIGAPVSPRRLRAILRVLVPGGRLVLAGDASAVLDASTPGLIMERCATLRAGPGERSLRETGVAMLPRAVDFDETRILIAMKSPLDDPAAYSERVFANLERSGLPVAHAAALFGNPWLSNSMVNFNHRLRDVGALGRLAATVLARESAASSDALAARCVEAYLLLGDDASRDVHAVDVMADAIDRGLAAIVDETDPMSFRWTVSLLFVKARLLQFSGRLDSARDVYRQCAQRDARRYGVHLATKTTEAAFLAGQLSRALGDLEGAASDWTNGLHLGDLLLKATLDDVLIDATRPNLFNHGDGVREFALAWDNVARCANGLHLLRMPGDFDDGLLQGSFATEYQVVGRDLHATRRAVGDLLEQIDAERIELVSRTERLERATASGHDAALLVSTIKTEIDAVVDILGSVDSSNAETLRAVHKARAALGMVTGDLVQAFDLLRKGNSAS